MAEEQREELSLDEYGCLFRKTTENGREIAITPFLFTWAIIADVTETGYEDRWCYHELVDAIQAFSEWDGVGEPKGWHRHPNSGRRVDEHGNIYVAQ